jgi:biotin carboxylase
VLVEELVRGPEVTVSGFSAGGAFAAVAVCDRLTADVPAFGVALAQVWPSPYGEAAAEVARRAVTALGIEEGPTFSKLRLSRGGPEVIEVGARLGGGYDAELVRLVTGLDLNELAIAAALGDTLTPRDLIAPGGAPVAGAAARFLIAPPGSLESVEVPQGLSGVVSTRVYRDPGHVFGRFRRAADRAGAVLAAGPSPADALARAEDAAERIRFVTADSPAIRRGSRQAAAVADVRAAPS